MATRMQRAKGAAGQARIPETEPQAGANRLAGGLRRQTSTDVRPEAWGRWHALYASSSLPVAPRSRPSLTAGRGPPELPTPGLDIVAHHCD